ncbi:hypothetical protein Dxin01_02875 [Deinococcus xinjiangensis]|uniref:KOW domain-containing protein n=1 Tax=Deinococcus xinjiangensis TaxID=457454 RepID=A0ABP9VEH2_9DEIO
MKVGSKVTVTDGCFAGRIGIVKEIIPSSPTRASDEDLLIVEFDRFDSEAFWLSEVEWQED